VVTSRDVTLRENGEQVPTVRVVPGDSGGARTFGVVLVIDTSQSMRGAPIAAAMEAARKFAANRPAAQRLGIVFFSHDNRVGLPLTTGRAQISGALAAEPPLSKGTRLYDATAAALRQLHDAKVSVGSLVVLSDGADVGSVLQPSAVADAARRTHTRVFTVGLRSRSYNGSTLRELAAASGGRYAEAAPAQLGTLFTALGQRFGREYLVTYRSTAPAGRHVNVAASVAGEPGTARATYSTPRLPEVALAPEHKNAFWSSTRSLVIAAVIAAVLLGLVLYLIIKPSARSVPERISAFITEDFGLAAQSPEEAELMSALSTGGGSSARVTRSRAWRNFAENVDISRVDIPARRLATFTIVATAVAVLFAGAVLGNAFLGFVALGLPFLVVYGVRIKADRARNSFEAQLPDNLQVVASAMRAGQSFTGALTVAVEDAAEPARRELNRAVTDERLGLPVDEALARAAKRMHSEELEYVGLVAKLQRDTGGNTAEVIDRVTDTIRERAELRREVRTLTAQGRLAGGIVSSMPIFLVIVFGSLQPGFFSPMIHTGVGRLLTFIGTSLLVVGWLTIRRLVDIKI
jgi:tight adherence protein B